MIGNRISRRHFLATSTAAAVGVVASAPLLRAQEAKAIKLGFVLPLTGPFAEAGQLQKVT